MKKLLFNFSNHTQFIEQFKLIDAIKQDQLDFEFIFLINDYSEGLNREIIINKLSKFNIKFFFSKNLHSSKKKIQFSIALKVLKIITYFSEAIKGYNYQLYYYKIIDSRNQMLSYKKFLMDVKPNILIVSEDGPGSNIHLIKAAKDMGINSMILPYEYSGTQQMIIGAKNRFVYSAKEKGLTLEMFKKNFFDLGSIYSGFYSKEEVLAYTKMKTLPPNPKIVHGGLAEKIACESQAMMYHYISQGLPANKIVLTGSVNDDLLVDLIKRKEKIKDVLYTEFGFDKKLKLMVFSFIPEYPGNLIFGNYENYIRTVAIFLSKLKNFNVVFQFHPAVSDDKRKIALNLNLPISTMPTIELIAISDIYITSYSSTIRWAIAASVPVINIDMYGFKYEDFSNCAGVKTINSKTDFEFIMSELSSGSTLFEVLKEEQELDSKNWGLKDSQSTTRIINLINNLCQ